MGKVVSSATLLWWGFAEAQSSWCSPKCLWARPSRWNSKWIPHLPRQWVSRSFSSLSQENIWSVAQSYQQRQRYRHRSVCLKSGGRGMCTSVLGAKKFTVKLLLLETRQCLWESLCRTNLAKLKDVFFCTILIRALLKIISVISVVAGV